MVEANARDGHACDGLGRRRGVPATAQAALEHGHVDAGLGEEHHGRHRERVELGHVVGALPRRGAPGVHALAGGARGRDAVGEGGLRDRTAPDLHSLGVAHELRGGVERDGEPLPR